jgi:DNA polymerase/3'-5' exonuclease PolX
MRLDEARTIAEQVCSLLGPACEEITIAGSIRREKSEVKDIEIVCRPVAILDLFNEPTSNILDAQIDWAMEREVHLGWDRVTKRNGDKYKRFWWAVWNPSAGIAIDLFIADERNYGNTLAIRTGNSDFSRLLVTQRIHGGLMRPTMRQRDGYLWAQGDGDAFYQLVPCPEEKHFFAALGVHPIPAPRERDVGCIDGLRRAWS